MIERRGSAPAKIGLLRGYRLDLASGSRRHADAPKRSQSFPPWITCSFFGQLIWTFEPRVAAATHVEMAGTAGP
jgi:hypothetical protein